MTKAMDLDRTLEALLGNCPSGLSPVPPPAWLADQKIYRTFKLNFGRLSKWAFPTLQRFVGGFNFLLGKHYIQVYWLEVRRVSYDQN